MTKYKVLEVFVISLLFIMWALPAFAQVDTAWVRTYNGPGNAGDAAIAIAVDDSGNVYVTGQSFGDWTTEDDYATVKYYPSGDTGWVRRYNGTGSRYDYVKALTVDRAGNIYITGYSIGSWPYYEWATIKYHPNGDTGWVRRYSRAENVHSGAQAITVDRSSNVYVTGYSANISTGSDYTTIKYDSLGNELWVRTYDGTNEADLASAIAVDIFGNVYVTGYSVGSDTEYDYATIKYYTNGDTAWVRRYNGPENKHDAASAIALDGLGNVYVTGYSNASETYRDYATIKYDSSGNELWVRKYSGEIYYYEDWARAIAIDGSGNIYVTGNSVSLDTWAYDDYATIKYYANGDTDWVRKYNGPGNLSDQACDIAIDDLGNVYVTGGSQGNGTDYDFAIVKYYPNGDTAWVKRYNGSGNYRDEASAIAIDNYGNIYVTGVTWSGTSYDFATIKYVQGGVFVEEQNQDNLVHSFVLSQNYPNPFNPQTVIEYTLNSPSEVSLRIFNIKGQLVKKLIDGHREKGFHQVIWDGTDQKGEKTSSGIYFYQIKAKDYVETKKMVKLK
ncbi:MAG: SBBP repeat-containing protein [Candidatus Zixiibacteriota bacterium]